MEETILAEVCPNCHEEAEETVTYASHDVSGAAYVRTTYWRCNVCGVKYHTEEKWVRESITKERDE
jgi:uncharacterized protein with PIN domain